MAKRPDIPDRVRVYRRNAIYLQCGAPYTERFRVAIVNY